MLHARLLVHSVQLCFQRSKWRTQGKSKLLLARGFWPWHSNSSEWGTKHLPCEFGANPFSGSRDISYTNKNSHSAKNRTLRSSLCAVNTVWNRCKYGPKLVECYTKMVENRPHYLDLELGNQCWKLILATNHCCAWHQQFWHQLLRPFNGLFDIK